MVSHDKFIKSDFAFGVCHRHIFDFNPSMYGNVERQHQLIISAAYTTVNSSVFVSNLHTTPISRNERGYIEKINGSR